ncbi:tetratricopeptide repeat protein [Paenibacillus lentus]|uniref:J domain-containing protein n=1 Tax=Paenibacillus lentus TaxID=1338368 RepID=UPI003668786E
MRIWTILGIEQTYDTSVIRRAYAKKLQIHHPEDDPQGYQQLREAYDQAMRLAKQHQQSQINISFTEEEEESSSSFSQQSLDNQRKEQDVVSQDENVNIDLDDARENYENDRDEEDMEGAEAEEILRVPRIPKGELSREIDSEQEEEPDVPRIPRLPKWSYETEERLDESSEEVDEEDIDEDAHKDAFEEELEHELEHQPESDHEPEQEAEESYWDDEEDFDEYDDEDDFADEFNEDYDEPAHPVNKFMDEVNSLYLDFSSRMDIHPWLELLSSDTLWNIDNQRAISDKMLEYLEQNYFLPSEVWQILEDSFRWKERSMEDEDFSEQYPKIYAYAIIEFPVLRMDFNNLLQAQHIHGIHHDDFLRYREALALALLENDMHSAHLNLIKALDIFKEDKDLIRLQTEFYRRAGDLEKALASCNEYIRIDPENNDAAILRARFLLGMDKAAEALEDLHRVLALAPNHIEALSLAGQCHMKLEQLEQAKSAFNKVLAIDREEIEAVLYLAQIHRHNEENLHQLKRQERKNAQREINEELGRLPLRSRLQRAAVLLLSRRWPILAIIIVLHLIIGEAIVKQTGVSPWVYAKLLVSPPAAVTVENASALDTLPVENHAVRLKLTNALYMGILEIKDSKAKKSDYQYIHMDEAKRLGLMDQLSGYVCIGYAGDASVIIISNYEQAMSAYQEKTMEITGEARPNLPQQLKQQVEGWQQNQSGSQSYLKDHPLSDYYIIAKDGIIRNHPAGKLSANILYLTALLILFYIPFIQELRRQWRYMRYN